MYIEQYVPVVKYSGLNTLKDIDFSGATTCALPSGTTIGGSSVVALASISSSATTGAVFSVTDTGIYTGVGMTQIIANSATTGVACLMTANGLTSGSVLSLTSTGTIVTTGEVLNIAANTATTCTGLLRISGTGLTDGFAMEITGGGANVTATGGGINLTLGAATAGTGLQLTTTGVYSGTTGMLAITADSATTGVLSKISGNGLTSGTGMLITSSGTMTGAGNLLTLTANSATTAAGIFRINANGLTSGIGAVITSSATALTGAGRLWRVDHTGTTSTSGIIAEYASAANDETVILKVTASDINALGTAFAVSTATTTGNGINVTANALTDGYAITASSSATGMTSTGRLLYINHTGNAGVSTIIGEVASAAADETVVFKVTASGAITGKVEQVSALAMVTGIGHEVRATAATLTTGRYYSAHDAAGEVFGVGTNGHLISTVSASVPTIAVTQQNGITAAAITAGGSDTCGIITTTGTNNAGGTTVLQVTFGKTYTSAPKAVILTPRNAAAAKVAATSLAGVYVSATTATTFDITIPSDASAGATPSWNYLVVA